MTAFATYLHSMMSKARESTARPKNIRSLARAADLKEPSRWLSPPEEHSHSHPHNFANERQSRLELNTQRWTPSKDLGSNAYRTHRCTHTQVHAAPHLRDFAFPSLHISTFCGKEDLLLPPALFSWFACPRSIGQLQLPPNLCKSNAVGGSCFQLSLVPKPTLCECV